MASLLEKVDPRDPPSEEPHTCDMERLLEHREAKDLLRSFTESGYAVVNPAPACVQLLREKVAWDEGVFKLDRTYKQRMEGYSRQGLKESIDYQPPCAALAGEDSAHGDQSCESPCAALFPELLSLGQRLLQALSLATGHDYSQHLADLAECGPFTAAPQSRLTSYAYHPEFDPSPNPNPTNQRKRKRVAMKRQRVSTPADPARLAAPEHTDRGLLTLVCEVHEGLEVYSESRGQWSTAQTTGLKIVVMPGATLEARLVDCGPSTVRAARHRVLLPAGTVTPRRCVVFRMRAPHNPRALLCKDTTVEAFVRAWEASHTSINANEVVVGKTEESGRLAVTDPQSQGRSQGRSQSQSQRQSQSQSDGNTVLLEFITAEGERFLMRWGRDRILGHAFSLFCEERGKTQDDYVFLFSPYRGRLNPWDTPRDCLEDDDDDCMEIGCINHLLGD